MQKCILQYQCLLACLKWCVSAQRDCMCLCAQCLCRVHIPSRPRGTGSGFRLDSMGPSIDFASCQHCQHHSCIVLLIPNAYALTTQMAALHTCAHSVMSHLTQCNLQYYTGLGQKGF